VAVSIERLITSDILESAHGLGNERLAVNNPWNSVIIRWVLTYPELYEVGASNLGHIILYNVLNAQLRQLCERAYLPGKDLGAKLRATHTPLFAFESKCWLIEFDILSFSLSYELDATNILEVLDLAVIPKTWQERSIGNYSFSLSLPSQRVDRFAQNIANILGETRQSKLTFALEARTQRMRDIVNIGLTNEELLRGVKIAWEQGWDKIKLYFMIGLPGETDDNVLCIVETVRSLKRECWAQGRKSLSFNLMISNFTRKPHTPFQRHSVSTTEFQRKQNLLKQEFRQMRSVKVNFTVESRECHGKIPIVPNTTKVQRWRIWFGKQGNIALISHLDLMRLWNRAVRWAGQQLINLRDRLFEIDLVRVNHSESESKAIWRYLGSCCPVIGVILRPEQILSMLKVAEKAEFHLLHIHRQRLVLGI